MARKLSLGRVAVALLPLLMTSALAQAFPARVFVAAKSGSDLNSCDDVATPCRTFVGAFAQVNADGTIMVLESGGYGPLTIAGKGVTIDAPPGITAFIHPSSGDAITINAGFNGVTLRGLTLNGGTNNGITVNSVGMLKIENCFISGFTGEGIAMFSGGGLNLKGTDVTACATGVYIANTTGGVLATIDHCHFGGNYSTGFEMASMVPGFSSATATYSTANNNNYGWVFAGSGMNVVNLEFCSGSENGIEGLFGDNANASSVVRYSNCIFANNLFYGVEREGTGAFETRGNNTITGNGISPAHGLVIGSFAPM